MPRTNTTFRTSDIPALTLLDRPAVKSWWAGLWRGLVVDQSAKHYKAMRSAIWLYMYLLLHADRQTGVLTRKLATIARDMQVNIRTIQYWFAKLRKAGYVIVRNSGRSLEICIQKWKPLRRRHHKHG